LNYYLNLIAWIRRLTKCMLASRGSMGCLSVIFCCCICSFEWLVAVKGSFCFPLLFLNEFISKRAFLNVTDDVVTIHHPDILHGSFTISIYSFFNDDERRRRRSTSFSFLTTIHSTLSIEQSTLVFAWQEQESIPSCSDHSPP